MKINFSKARSSNNKTYCCVPTCRSQKRKCPDISFHKFPSPAHRVKIRTGHDKWRMFNRRQYWVTVLRLTRQPSKYMSVCSLHFQPDDFFRSGTPQRNLKRTAVPSANLPNHTDIQYRKRQYVKENNSINLGESTENQKPKMKIAVRNMEDLEAAAALLLFST